MGDRKRAESRGRVVVDSDPQVLCICPRRLADAGYTPVVAYAPEEVEHLILEERPHLVLLDPALPDANGLGLIQRVLQLTDAPVVLLSRPGGDPDLARAFEAGIDDYIVKPFSSTELAARVVRRATTGRPNRDARIFQLGDRPSTRRREWRWKARRWR